jgi:RNA polymerase sigma-70 factor (ECF subfamily)
MPTTQNYPLHHNNSDPSQLGSETSESSLLLAARRGDHEAFGQLCQRHSRRILQVARRIVRNHEDAEDVLQDALLSAYVHIAQFDGRSRFSTWLMSIAINSSLMRLRKNRLRPTVSLEFDDQRFPDRLQREFVDSSPGPDMIFARQQGITQLKRAISEIRPLLRETIEFQAVHERSAKDAALEFGISISAAKTRLFRAKADVRKKLNANR